MCWVLVIAIVNSMVAGAAPTKDSRQFDSVGEMKEYCHLESFNATCPDGHVLLMQYARYGRMKLGRCLTTSYYVGCYADILRFADAKCSGKQSCIIRILDPDLVTFQPCRKDLMAYLEASYTCVPVQTTRGEICPNRGHYDVTDAYGYLSLAPREMTIGTPSCPWFIHVQPGQRIVWTLFDFNDLGYKSHLNSNTPKCPYSFKFLEGDAEVDVPVCTGRQRESEIYTTRRHHVKVYTLSQTPGLNPATFLLNFRAVGCPDFLPVADAWIRRSESTAVVVCNSTRETWHFVCRDNYWVGELRNCTQLPKADVITSTGGLRYTLHYGILLAVALGLVLGIFFGAVLLVCMFIHRVRKRHRKRVRRTDRDLLQGESLEDKEAVSIPLRHGDHFDSNTGGYMTEDTNNICSHAMHFQFPTDDLPSNIDEGPDIIYASRMNIRCQNNCVACQGPQVLGVPGLGVGPPSHRRSQDNVLTSTNSNRVGQENIYGTRNAPENIYDTRNAPENIYGTRNTQENIYGMRNAQENIYGTRRSQENLLNGAPTNRTVSSNQTKSKDSIQDIDKRMLYSKEGIDRQVVTTL